MADFNDKNIAKEILMLMIEKKLGEFYTDTEDATTDKIGEAYQNILSYIIKEPKEK